VDPPSPPAALLDALRKAIAAGPEERAARGRRARAKAMVRYARANTDEMFADVIESVVAGSG
jgi:hypothetical protein